MNYNPTGSYGIAKYHAEMQMADNKKFNEAEISCSIIRPTNFREGRLGILEILFDWVRSNKNTHYR